MFLYHLPVPCRIALPAGMVGALTDSGYEMYFRAISLTSVERFKALQSVLGMDEGAEIL
jgi:hypothetical protein